MFENNFWLYSIKLCKINTKLCYKRVHLFFLESSGQETSCECKCKISEDEYSDKFESLNRNAFNRNGFNVNF